MDDGSLIESVQAMTVRAQLPEPISFGSWIIPDREYALVRVRTHNGVSGFAYGLTRDGAVVEQIRKSVGPLYVEKSVDAGEESWELAWRRSPAAHGDGVGLRALSLVDLAVWDNAARAAGKSIEKLLGGGPRPSPVTAIIGYPPSSSASDVAVEARRLFDSGWRRFKLPVSSTVEVTASRLRAVRDELPTAWIGLDGAWTWDDPIAAAEFINSVGDVALGWFEDVFPPGDIYSLSVLRNLTSTKIAAGDEQATMYFPGAVIDGAAVDVVRLDATCMGGLTRLRRLVARVQASGLALSLHMFGHVHSQIASGLGLEDCPIEWSVPGTGVDPYTDSLVQPAIHNGFMGPLGETTGFGELVNADWIRSQPHDDPDKILSAFS